MVTQTPTEYTKSDYRGIPSTLCQGCGHNSISNQIITACFELGFETRKTHQVQRDRMFQ